ncbi:MAG: pyridoxal-phosphate dependent enzyme [Planctomycetota bacterium]|nr:pyridoxal-phosphate dependent enzyme [Planctomycetota bacterium]
MVGIEDIRQAARRIDGIAHRTPVITCGMLDDRSGRSLSLKCEHLQKVGAFKFRGACNAVMGLGQEEADRGVVTHSSGNHAQALALAARIRGIHATIVMPVGAPGVKRRAVEEYGAKVIECEATQDAREAAAARIVDEEGATFIAPYDDPRIIAGQGTTFLELHEEVQELDALVVPLGGGGLLSGMALAARALRPDLHIIGVEPELADDARESIEVGHIVPQRPPRTICDGLRTSLGSLTFPIIRDHVDEIVSVPDELTIEVMRYCWERSKLVLEPSGVIGVAAVMDDAFRGRPGLERTAIVLTGGNLDLERLPWQN